jgi:hypothetical protein
VLDRRNEYDKTELCEGIRTILIYNGKLIRDFGNAFAYTAIEVLPEFFGSYIKGTSMEAVMLLPNEIAMRFIRQKIFTLYAKYEEVMRLCEPGSPFFNHTRPVNPETRNNTTIIQKMEQTFAEEITALYYMNLVSGKVNIVSELQYEGIFYLTRSECTAQDCLSVILENDSSLMEWFSKWMEDLVTLENQRLQNAKAKIRQLGIEKMVSAV